MTHHHPTCEWVKAKRELCNCERLAAMPVTTDPFARIIRLEQELDEWRRRHGALISRMIIAGVGTRETFDLAEAARQDVKDDISDLL